MSQDVKVPEVGESITSGILTAWLKQDGETVAEGDELFELETDKATLAIPSPFAGTLCIQVEVDAEVSVGQVVATIAPASAGAGQAPRAIPGLQTAPPARGGEPTPAASAPSLSPAVRVLVAEHNLDPAAIVGTGKGGRLTKADVLSALEAREASAASAPQSVSAHTPLAASAPAAASKAGDRRQTREKMTRIRRSIAERLVQAKQGSAHLTTFNEIDMSRVMAIRAKYRDAFNEKHGIKLGFMSFFVKACCQALAAFPAVNATIDGEHIVYNHYYDIGVAVSTERGLIVPVMRNADALGFADIERAILSFVTRAREKKLTLDELTGGTFSITNGGVFGSMLSTPIPNPPQTAILGMHAIKKRPVVADDAVVIRPVMYVALTYDHRLIDGREAVSFLVKIKQSVEDPTEMLLGM